MTAELVRQVYEALGTGDREALERLLDPEFDARLADGMPCGAGGGHRGAQDMIENGWWALGRAFSVRPEAEEWIECAGDRLLVLGRYRGRARSEGGVLDAGFAHLWTARDGRVTALRQFTDTARWHAALAPNVPDAGP